MARENTVQSIWINPFEGLAESVVTSNIIDLRDAQAVAFSWYTTSGTTSAHTFQVSNSSVRLADTNPAAASFVNYTTFGTGTPAGIVVDTGFRYGRILRDASNATLTIDLNKLV